MRETFTRHLDMKDDKAEEDDGITVGCCSGITLTERVGMASAMAGTNRGIAYHTHAQRILS
jgi:hypothetical protein